MTKKKVYLAGPITGCSYGSSEDWRDLLKARSGLLLGDRFEFFSPLRGKDYLKSEKVISDTYEQYKMSTAKGIMRRDFHDVMTSDAVIANFLGASRVSIGTVMEVAWAYQLAKPVIIIDGAGSMHDHAMLNEASWYKADDVDEALIFLRHIFVP